MSAPRAVIFDLGGTLVDFPEWDTGALRWWARSYDHLVATWPCPDWPDRETYVKAMRAAELAHWRRVDREHWSGPPEGLVREGLDSLAVGYHDGEVMAALDGYADAIVGASRLFPDTVETLRAIRERGYRTGLLSNTWWAAKWHDADLAAHGLTGFFDAVAYTSDLPRSKPHASVFLEVARRLDVTPAACVMIGDRQVDDVSGAIGAGMRGVWRRNESPWPKSEVAPSGVVDALGGLPGLLREWGGR